MEKLQFRPVAAVAPVKSERSAHAPHSQPPRPTLCRPPASGMHPRTLLGTCSCSIKTCRRHQTSDLFPVTRTATRHRYRCACEPPFTIHCSCPARQDRGLWVKQPRWWVWAHTHTQLICLSAVLSISCAWTANLRIILNCLISFEQLEAETRTETSSLHPWIELNVSLLPSPLPLFSSTRLSIP